ncbi:gibberellin 2-beta-dioxygenase 6-like [Punica granatum]|uniref:gibberellin 2beta-dioxygenase n=2 Tax=Punica granatum TaxID=22663 RepID=A0A218X0U0_PUNGR|nr:gibberellin 2-beta-dioxygenase 6-like [Punica granatum]OWM78339.1 hypothetical protein CDL15_Pgr016063 [Punica granatum]PKI65724.1 hypothetical protein CRG98_013871 [Punica granatum]
MTNSLKYPKSGSNSSPPLLQNYGELLQQLHKVPDTDNAQAHNDHGIAVPPVLAPAECQLPLIDLSPYTRGSNRSLILEGEELERQACAANICRASSQWGFFQVVNHGINHELLWRMRREQARLFEAPFETKANSGLLNNSYRWGTPSATCPAQFSWSEAFHIPLTKISDAACYGDYISLREVMMELAAAMSKLARMLVGILAERMGHQKGAFDSMCEESTCFLRLNRYPACPVLSHDTFGLVPHTDSNFLTILSQDQVGGLHLLKDSQWVAVKPNQEALIVNIGDLLQAWSNDVYKSVEHKVMTNEKMERYSIAYFLCPSYESLIGNCREPSVYRKFTFGEYRHQVQEDVKSTGRKVGLPHFRLQQTLAS